MNRRDFLKTLGVGAAAVSINPTSGWPELKGAVPVRDPEWHVLNRLGYGPRPGDLQALKKKGFETYLKEQLDPQIIAYNNRVVQPRIDTYVTLKMHLGELVKLNVLDGILAVKELDAATLIRAMFNKSQLFEVMTHFWSEHFSIWHFKDFCDIFKTTDDAQVIRANALGNFRKMLHASAKSPAMLFYLDNGESYKEHPNENYARELMELHTITIGNYTEQDVKEVARCFTGWTYAYRELDPTSGFRFFAAQHDQGEKTVLGHTIPAGGGVKDGEMVIDLLASHPATATHIASKLCRRFIADDPPPNVVKDAAASFMKSDGDIPTVLKTIFAAPEFWNAPPKFKRPYEYTASVLRATAVAVDPDQFKSMTFLNRKYAKVKAAHPGPLDSLQAMGHLPHNHVTPEGYTDYASLWQTDMLERWNLAHNVTTNVFDAIKFNLDSTLQQQGIQPKVPAILSFYANMLYGREMTDQEAKVITDYVGADTNIMSKDGRRLMLEALGLMLSAPAFQWR